MVKASAAEPFPDTYGVAALLVVEILHITCCSPYHTYKLSKMAEKNTSASFQDNSVYVNTLRNWNCGTGLYSITSAILVSPLFVFG